MDKNEKIPARPHEDSGAGGKHNTVQTYAEDMAKAIENDKSLVRKIIHEEEELENKKNLPPESKKNKLLMLVGIVLIMLALITLSFFFFKKNINTIEVEKQFVPIIFNDQSTFLEVFGLKRDEITQTVLNEINATKVKAGGIEGIYLTENKQMIGLRRLITLIKSHFIPDDNTLFVSDNFLMGVVNNETPLTSGAGKNFFMLIQIRSISDIFNSMRIWESNIMTDLHGFLGINITSDTNYLFTKSFEDGIVENKNARMLYDQEGKLVLMYIFADDNSVVITDSEKAAHEIALRLASSKTKQ